MIPPAFTPLGNCLRFHWEAEGVRIELDDLHADRFQAVRSQITITIGRGPEAGLIHQSSFNLTWTRDRQDIVRKLENRLPDLDAVGMLEQVCYQALKRWREGEPASDLRIVAPMEGARLLLEPFVESEGATILHADGSSGKTTLAEAIAVSVAWGVDILGAVPTRTAPALILDWRQA